MRLTLRTLLAFLDNVLTPSEKASLGDKISKSQTSRGIIERIRRVLVSPNLSAPKIGTPNSANDPNPIAEYIDNTYPATKISEIEVQCLSDDARLAEVAACHQILTLALKQPASVPSDLKAKIVGLQSNHQQTVHGTHKTEEQLIEKNSPFPEMVEIGANNVPVEAPMQLQQMIEPDVLRSENPRPLPNAGIELDDNLAHHVPEYLRRGTSKDWGTPATILALVTALLLVAWLSLGSWSELQELISPSTPPTILNKRSESFAEQPTASKPIDTSVPTGKAEANAASLSKLDGVANSDSIEPSESAQNELGSIEMKSQDSEAKPNNALLPPDNLVDRNLASANSSSTQDSSISPKPIASNDPHASNASDPSLSFLKWKPQSDDEAKTKMILTLSREPGKELRRLKAGESLPTDESLIVPPSMRTSFEVSSGLSWIAADESILASESQKSSPIPKIIVHLGRALVESSNRQHKFVIATPKQELKLEFQGESSSIAVELRYLLNKGYRLDVLKEGASDEQQSSFAIPILRICGVRGSTRVSSLNSEPVVISVAEGLEWQGEEVVGHWTIPSMNDVPWWYENSTMRPIDGQALDGFQMLLGKIDPATSAMKTLHDIEQSRLAEISLIAVRSRLLLGDYSNVFGTEGFLSNPSSRAHRAIVLETLLQSVASTPEGPRNLVKHIESTEPARALRLLDLLTMPTNEQLAEGADRRLVEGLSSPFLDERAVSIYQLKLILGREFGYQVERQNNDSLQTWKRLLTSGKIRWSKK